MASAEQQYIEYEKANINQSHVPSLIAAFTVSLVLAYGGVAARLYSRHLIKGSLQAEDYLILLSLLFTTGFIVPNCVYIGVYNFGRHEILVTDPVALTKAIQAAEIIYTAGIFCFKASICCLFWRLFPVRWFRLSQVAVIAFVFAYSATQIVCILVTCIPIEAIWNPNVKGTCININDVYIVVSAFNIFTDVVILALPMPLLWGLNAARSRKIQLSIMFALGALVCIASIVRITQLSKVSLVDPSYSDFSPVTWSALEMAFGTLGACMPTYSPLVLYIRGGRAALDSRRTHTVTQPKTFGNASRSGDHLAPSEDGMKHPFVQLDNDEEIAMGRLSSPTTPRAVSR